MALGIGRTRNGNGILPGFQELCEGTGNGGNKEWKWDFTWISGGGGPWAPQEQARVRFLPGGIGMVLSGARG